MKANCGVMFANLSFVEVPHASAIRHTKGETLTKTRITSIPSPIVFSSLSQRVAGAASVNPVNRTRMDARAGFFRLPAWIASCHVCLRPQDV